MIRGVVQRLRRPLSPPKRQVRILVVAGGGIRGLLAARFLDALMGRVGRRVQDVFHLFAGTSTGSLIGLTQVRPDPMDLADVAQLYRNFGPQIFYRSQTWGLRTNWGLGGPKYPDTGLIDCTQHVAGDLWLSEAAMDFLVPAYSLNTGKPHWFRSWEAKDPSQDFRLAEVGLASSSAPTYFPAAHISASDGSAHYFVDGGLFANSPSLRAIEEAKLRYPKANEILLVSIGTGEMDIQLPAEKAQNWGILGWVAPLISVLQTVHEDHQHASVEARMAGQPYFDFDRTLNNHIDGLQVPSPKLDKATEKNMARLDALADYWIDSFRDKLDEAAELLMKVRAPLSVLM